MAALPSRRAPTCGAPARPVALSRGPLRADRSRRPRPSPAQVATALGTDPGAPVIERRRITYAADDTPLATSTTYFPILLTDQCPALLSTDRITKGTTLYIEQQTGRTAAKITADVACTPGGTEPDSDAA